MPAGLPSHARRSWRGEALLCFVVLQKPGFLTCDLGYKGDQGRGRVRIHEGLARGDRNWRLNKSQTSALDVSTGYNPAEGNRRASRVPRNPIRYDSQLSHLGGGKAFYVPPFYHSLSSH
jgi:hypothetical protein